MKKVVILSIFLLSFVSIVAQCDCNDIFNYRGTSEGFTLDSGSISGFLESDNVYTHKFEVQKSTVYRFSFFASPVFNANMDFKITNSKGEVVLNLSGLTDTINNRKAALEPTVSNLGLKHPYFDFIVTNADKYTLEIRTNPMKYNVVKYDWEGNKIFVEKVYYVSGCVTFYVQSRKLPVYGFVARN